MAWTGGYLTVGNGEHLIVPTGILVSSEDVRDFAYTANATVTNWGFTGTAPADGDPAVTWSVAARVRFRRRWVRDGSSYLPDSREEIVLDLSIVPVDVDDGIETVYATEVRWSVWRIT